MDLLGLADFRVLVVDEHTYDFHFQVVLAAPPLQCVQCGQHKLYRHETKPQLFMDLPIRGKRVGITVQRRRYRCCTCHCTFFEALPCMNESHFMTNRLITYIQQEALRRTFVSIANEVGLAESTIRAVFGEFAATIQPRIPDTELLSLGIDELYLLQHYRCVVTDVASRQIIDLLRERTKATVISYLQHLPDPIKEHITVVCTDTWASYHEAVREVLPHAHLVVDKFHVLKLLSGCLETVRKEVRASLTGKQRRTLMHDRFLLLRRAGDLDESERLLVEAWLKNFPRLETAYHLKEAFYHIYEAQTEEAALQRYFAWFAGITPDIYEAFLPLTLAIEHYGDAIFNYFTHRYTAGYTESLNGLMKLTQRMGRGYSFEAIRAKVLLTNGLRKASRPAYGKDWSTHADPTSTPVTSDVSNNSSILNCAVGAKQPQPPQSS